MPIRARCTRCGSLIRIRSTNPCPPPACPECGARFSVVAVSVEGSKPAELQISPKRCGACAHFKLLGAAVGFCCKLKNLRSRYDAACASYRPR